MVFEKKGELSPTALNILQKRYFRDGETTWEEVADRIIEHVCKDEPEDTKDILREMIALRYFIPNSPCIVNSGTEGGGLSACFVVDLEDTIEDIYKTKLNFALIARKGGGCGTTLTKLRPEGSKVSGSTHGYSAGPVNFFNTICHDMEIIAQGGFRAMAMMGTMSVYHPDILKFINAKTVEGKMSTTNISVVVDNQFMQNVVDDTNYSTKFNGKEYNTLRAKEIFDSIVEGAWQNGEPGLLFYDTINNSPYSFSNQEILATNPCGEQPLPPNGACNLGSLDISKFLDKDNTLDMWLLETAIRHSVIFLDDVVSVSSYPTKEITEWSLANRPIGLGIMGLADYYIKRGIAYGSDKALEELEFILSFMKGVAEDESVSLGEDRGVPDACKLLPVPRRNITLLSIAPTGTISLLAGCNSSIEPFFSEITSRVDNTGSYTIDSTDGSLPDYYRCAVSANGAKEVTWEEHVRTQASAQKFIDSGVSKTINFPNHTHRDTIAKAFILAWQLGCKGITIYRNGSREIEVLSPKNIKKDLCPVCESPLVKEANCKHCSSCDWSMCETG
jgi:ribonucleoside-diphosphate reductase alpha chain